LAYFCWDLYTLPGNPKHGIGVYGLSINSPTPLGRNPEEMRKALDAADRGV
jgi:hypothetical protein